MSLEDGGTANVSHLSCSVHTGTHVDAPRHFIEGAPAVDQMALDVLLGPAHVCYLPGAERIYPSDLERLGLPQHAERLLLRTRNSELWARNVTEFTPDYVALTAEAAQWLVRRGIRLIGVDYLSVQLFDDPEPTTHRTLLAAGVIIIEGLNLHNVAPGVYHLVCLPLRLAGADGAPARAVLMGT